MIDSDTGKSQTIQKPSDYAFPPIHLHVPEAELSDKQQKSKEELVDISQTLEGNLHRYGMVYHHEELEKAINSLISVKALGDRADGFAFRVYVIKSASVNAMATPSGSIYIHSGLLAALDNFNQLRYVLGHEAHHVIDQDAVYQYQKMKDEAGTLKVLQLIATPIVAAAISNSSSGRTIANIYAGATTGLNLIYNLSSAGYGKHDERECDHYSAEVLHQEGHGLSDILSVFEIFEDQQAKYGKGFQTHLFSDHDRGNVRIKHLKEFAESKDIPIGDEKIEADPEYYRLTKEIRIENARINILNRRIYRALEDLDRLEKFFPDDIDIKFLRAEASAVLYEYPDAIKEEVSNKTRKSMNLKKEKEQKEIWLADSKKMYSEILEINPDYTDAHRGLALVLEIEEKYAEAKKEFELYAAARPDADDIRFVKAKIKQMDYRIEQQETEKKKDGK